MKPVRLEVEYKRNPLGIDAVMPRLSWILESEERGAAQSAYHILVSSSPDSLAQDKGDLWDSGRVDSERSTQIVYGGAALGSRQQCWWKVRVWDQDGEPGPFSDDAFWSMGLLNQDDWTFNWITFFGPLDVPEKGPEVMRLDGAQWVAPEEGVRAGRKVGFRKRLEIPSGKTLKRARLLLSAGGQFTLYLDGEEAGESDGRFWAWKRPVQLDVTEKLTPGDHLVAVDTHFEHCPAAGVIARLLFEFDDGDKTVLETDETWKTAADPEAGWVVRGFDDSVWENAQIKAKANEGPWGELGQSPLDIPACPYLRKPFSLKGTVERATVYVTALGAYEMRLNGKKVGQDVLTPGWSDFRKRVYYQTYDVTDMLETGDNVMGAVLGHGWYSGYLGWDFLHRGYYGKTPYLRAQLEVRYADGAVETVGSDAGWRAAYGPVIGSDIYMGEQYDARRELPGWDAPGFDASDWKQVFIGTPTNVPLEAYPGVQVRHIMDIPAKSMEESEPGVYIYDLGQNMVGTARIRVKGEAGTKVTLRFAEMLDNGKLYIENLRGARAIDEYWMRGDEEEVWEPAFTFHGFRYVEISGLSYEPPLDAVTGVVLHSDTPLSGTFECSHPMVNQLQHNIQWGQRGNFLEVPTDCPQRDERLGWMGDAQVFARTACYNMDTAAFFTKWMQDVRDGQGEAGDFPNVAPRAVAEEEGSPAWGDAGIIVPWTVYLCYGDTRILEESYPSMVQWLEYIKRDNPDLLWRTVRGNHYGDWLSIQAHTPKDVIGTAYFAHSTRLVARIAAVLGEDYDAARYEGMFQDIKDAFIREFVKEDGTVHGGTQTAYVLAIHFDLLPDELRGRAADHFVENIKERDWHASTGFVGCAHLMYALSDIGRNDVAYRLLKNDTFPSWGYSVVNGATTIWERWDGWTDDKGFQDPGMNSFNHYAYGAVGGWMYRYVAGIELDPAEPGYKHIIIQPQPGGGFTYAKGEYDSVHGTIVSDWRLDGDTFHLETVIPANTCATVMLPCRAPGCVTEGGKPVSDSAGVEFIEASGGRATFRVPAGRYVFESKA